MHGKRYKIQKYRQPSSEPNMALRIAISIAAAVAVSFALIAFGSFLGDKVPQEESTDPTEHTGNDTESDNSFVYKQIEAKYLGDFTSFADAPEDIFDTVSVCISDENGKLMYVTDINSIIYGDGISSSMKPVSAAIFDAAAYGKRISVRFAPFTSDDRKIADYCTAAVIESLASLGADEVVLIAGDIPLSSAERFSSEAGDAIEVGASIDTDVFLSESSLREYYTVFDFLTVDLSAYEVSSGGKTETETENPDESEVEIESGVEELPDALSLRKFLSENRLTIKKYSVRVRVRCTSAEEIAVFLGLCEEFDLEGYEIVTE